MFKHRLFHYALLLGATALLTLPNLGVHDLSDVDEGVNAEASREMLEAGAWITPLFNFEMRTAKPVLLYWMQIGSYSLLGVDEFAARLPSVIAAMGTVLLVYELGRSMFGFRTGLLAGTILGSCMEFCMLAHAATPDSVMMFFTVLTFYLFWIGSRNGSRAWFIPTGMAAGLAVMTKGPVGLVIPDAIIILYLLWNRELKRLLDWRSVWGFLAFLAVAAPWYIIVTLETRGAWTKQFMGQENIGRFLSPMENHGGPVFYHAVGILVLFAPWSIFLAPTVWHIWRSVRRTNPVESVQPAAAATQDETLQASRFLLCWAITYLVFFSIAATKLPNYVFASYAPIAIFTARFLEQWRLGSASPRRWPMTISIVILGAIGVFAMAGLALAGGFLVLPFGKIQVFPGLARWSWIGIIPLAEALAAWLCLRKGRPGQLIAAVAVSSIAFVGLLAAFPVEALDECAAPKRLVEAAELRQPQRDIRLVSLIWFEPSVVFYSRREVEKLDSWDQARDCLATRQPVYLFVPAQMWQSIQRDHAKEFHYRVVAQKLDFHKKYEVVVVTNQ